MSLNFGFTDVLWWLDQDFEFLEEYPRDEVTSSLHHIMGHMISTLPVIDDINLDNLVNSYLSSFLTVYFPYITFCK